MSEQEQDQLENEDLETETQEQDDHRDDDESEIEQPESEEFFIGLDGEEANQEEDPHKGEPAPEWLKRERAEIREIKKQERARERRIKELESELSVHRKPAEIKLGEKPTFESSGFDEEEFERQLTDWHAKKAQFDQQEKAKQAEQEKVAQQWQERVKNYDVKKTAIKTKVHDYDEAEEIARDTLTQTQQGILISGADNPELLIYHLGKNPAKAKELAAIQDPIQFAFKLAKIDAQLKVQQRKPTTSPEKKVEGSAPLSGIVDAKEAELEKKALKTGDRTELIQYRKSKKGK